MTDVIDLHTKELLPDVLLTDKLDKDLNVSYLQRRIKVTDPDLNIIYQISEIKRTKVTRTGTLGIKERMEIPKFGICKGQSRGTVEAGIVRIDNELKITNRKKAVFQEGLKDKLKVSASAISKEDLLQKMIDEQEKDRNMKISKMFKINENDERKKRRKREHRDTDIKITGFDMRNEEIDLIKIFEKVGPVKRCIIIRDRINKSIKKNIAYLEFVSSLHVHDAIEKFNNVTVGSGVLMVCRPIDDE